EEEQKKFYRIFEEYARLTLKTTDDDYPHQEHKRNKWRLFLISVLSLLIFTVIIRYFFSPPQINANFHVFINGENSTGNHKAIIGDTLLLDANPVFQSADGNVLSDSASIHLSWNTGEGWSDNASAKISVPVTKEGQMSVMLRVSKGNQYREHTERVDVCPVVI